MISQLGPNKISGKIGNSLLTTKTCEFHLFIFLSFFLSSHLDVRCFLQSWWAGNFYSIKLPYICYSKHIIVHWGGGEEGGLRLMESKFFFFFYFSSLNTLIFLFLFSILILRFES